MLTAFLLRISDADFSLQPANFAVRGKDSWVKSLDGPWKMTGQLRSTTDDKKTYAVDKSAWAIRICGNNSEVSPGLDAPSILDGFRREGIGYFSKLSGNAAATLFCEDILYLIASKTPGPTLYFHASDHSYSVSTELKALTGLALKDGVLDFDEAELHWQPWKTILKGVVQIPAGHFLRVDLKSGGTTRLLPYWSPQVGISSLDADALAAGVVDDLRRSIDAIPGDTVTSLVSGGLDSSLVTALAKEGGKRIYSYSIGTAAHNEFDYARRFASSIGSDHKELVVEAGELLGLYPEIVWLTEHHFSTYLEYLLPGHLALKLIKHKECPIISGYGADVLFGGFARPGDSTLKIDSLLATEYQSSLWAHETSQTLGGSYGISVHYPFFEPSVVQRAATIPTNLKFRNGWEKWILRIAASAHVSANCAWRRKVGIHQSTGSEDLLAPLFGGSRGRSKAELRILKDRLSYEILRSMLIDNVRPDEIDLFSMAAQLEKRGV